MKIFKKSLLTVVQETLEEANIQLIEAKINQLYWSSQVSYLDSKVKMLNEENHNNTSNASTSA